MRWPALLVASLLLTTLLPLPASAETLEVGHPIVMRAAAVSETPGGFVGSTATITITSATHGRGHVFLDTFPLTEVDMQGSARLASRVASQLTGKDRATHDFFFVVRSGAQQIGGPSAGATMTVGAIASLNGWSVRDDVLMTGTINADATIGPVGGIAEKAAAAADVGVKRFLFPAGEETVPLGDSQVNLTEHCATTLKIECIPVTDVIEAVGWMTDHAFDRPPLTGDVTGTDFLARLGPLSGELVNDAQKLYDEAAASLSIAPEGAAKTTLAERLAGAGALLARAHAETSNQTYYTAASTSFQSSIESHYVREASRYLAATDRPAAHAESMAAARARVQEVALQVNAATVQDTNSFEAVGAAQVRIMEAETRLASAQALAAQPRQTQDLFDALYQASYAAERARTAGWWLKLSEGFPPGASIETAALVEFARDIITTSTEEVAYIEAVFKGAGATGVLARSRELLDTAKSAMDRHYYAAAMLSALEAGVRGSVLLEIAHYGGNVPDTKIETAKEGAARAIQGARARGVESILAQSAYEFGLSLQDDADRLTFLGVARVTGNLAGLPGLFGGSAQQLDSRFQQNLPPLRVDVMFVVAAFAVGLALGAGAGLTALMPKRRSEDEFPPKRSEPAWPAPPTQEGATSQPPREE